MDEREKRARAVYRSLYFRSWTSEPNASEIAEILRYGDECRREGAREAFREAIRAVASTPIPPGEVETPSEEQTFHNAIDFAVERLRAARLAPPTDDEVHHG